MREDYRRMVAVILCTYEPSHFLSEQVDSILAQIDVNVEIFVFDDGSVSPKSKEILETIKCKVSKVYHCSPSKSAGKNFIRALSDFDISRFDYIALSDQDDLWLNDKLIRAVNCLAVTGAQGYSSNLIVYDGKDEIGVLSKSVQQSDYDHHFQGASAGCTYVLTKRLVEIIQRDLKKYNFMEHKKSFSHDWLIYFIARTNDVRWYMDNEAKILYRQHGSNVYGAKRGLFKKFTMVFGDWYSDNIFFISMYRNCLLDKFDVNCTFFEKLLFFPEILTFRREKVNSIVCYFFWLFKYKSKW